MEKKRKHLSRLKGELLLYKSFADFSQSARYRNKETRHARGEGYSSYLEYLVFQVRRGFMNYSRIVTRPWMMRPIIQSVSWNMNVACSLLGKIQPPRRTKKFRPFSLISLWSYLKKLRLLFVSDFNPAVSTILFHKKIAIFVS